MLELADVHQGSILPRSTTLAAVKGEILNAAVVIGAVLVKGVDTPPHFARRQKMPKAS